MKIIKSYKTCKFCRQCICGSQTKPIVRWGLYVVCENCYRDIDLAQCNVPPVHYLTASGKAKYLILINGWNNANS